MDTVWNDLFIAHAAKYRIMLVKETQWRVKLCSLTLIHHKNAIIVCNCLKTMRNADELCGGSVISSTISE